MLLLGLVSPLENALVLIVGGVPIAMPTVLSVTMAIGAAQLSKKQAIVSRLTAVEELAGMDLLWYKLFLMLFFLPLLFRISLFSMVPCFFCFLLCFCLFFYSAFLLLLLLPVLMRYINSSDKTGTLTQNVLTMDQPIVYNFPVPEVLEWTLNTYSLFLILVSADAFPRGACERDGIGRCDR